MSPRLLPSLLATERFPRPDFDANYVMPSQSFPMGQWPGWQVVDVAMLVAVMSLAAYLAIRKRSRVGILLLSVFSLAYFGFWRAGCVCPVGATQNIARGLVDPGFVVPWVVIAFFTLPLVFTLFFGRVFCAAACPLGAIQDLVALKPRQIPQWIDHALGLLAYVYLGFAVVLAANGGQFLICRYDPFVGFFRLNGPAMVLLIGAGLLLLGVWVARPYCRFLCPYSVLLRLFSRFAWRHARLAPKDCINCRLCETSCPINAISKPTFEFPEDPRRGTARLMLVVAAIPLILAAGAWGGWQTGSAMAGLLPNVQLSRALLSRPTDPAQKPSDLVRAFDRLNADPDAVHAQANQDIRRMRLGGLAAGGLVALAASARLLRFSRRPAGQLYDIERSACVSCARCLPYCPYDRSDTRPADGVAAAALPPTTPAP